MFLLVFFFFTLKNVVNISINVSKIKKIISLVSVCKQSLFLTI